MKKMMRLQRLFRRTDCITKASEATVERIPTVFNFKHTNKRISNEK